MNIPVVIGVPVGLIGKEFENGRVASLDLLEEVVSNLDVEIASHGYYHITPPLPLSSRIRILPRRIIHSPDKIDMLMRLKYFVRRAESSHKTQDPNYSPEIEIIESKRKLTNLLKKEIITFIYPGGYFDETVLKLVSENYRFARYSEIGFQCIDDLKDHMNRLLIETFSFSRFTCFEKVEKYYEKLAKLEKEKRGDTGGRNLPLIN